VDFLEKLTPDHIRAFEGYFLMGFVFRSVERTIRGAGKEEEVHTVVMSIVWSVVLSATLLIKQFDFPDWVEKSWRTPISLASLLLYSALVGVAWAFARPVCQEILLRMKGKLKKYELLKKALEPKLSDRAEDQCHVRFFSTEANGGKRVKVKLKNGPQYSGCVEDYESIDDPSIKAIRFTMRHLCIEKDGKWKHMPASGVMMLNLEDVESIVTVETPLPEDCPVDLPTKPDPPPQKPMPT